MEFPPNVDHAMEGLESEVLKEIISFVQIWQTIKVLISMHVLYESANIMKILGGILKMI